MKKTTKKKKVSPKNQRPRVVLVNRCIVFNKKGEILLIKRSMKCYYAPGVWEFPGGKLDEGQDLSGTLEREVLEETGLLILSTTKIAYTASYIIPSGKYKGLPYVVIIGMGKMVGGNLKLSDEHTDFKWVTIKEAYDMPIKDDIRKSLIVLEKNFKKNK